VNRPSKPFYLSFRHAFACHLPHQRKVLAGIQKSGWVTPTAKLLAKILIDFSGDKKTIALCFYKSLTFSTQQNRPRVFNFLKIVGAIHTPSVASRQPLTAAVPSVTRSS
jgi:hypothetical protein